MGQTQRRPIIIALAIAGVLAIFLTTQRFLAPGAVRIDTPSGPTALQSSDGSRVPGAASPEGHITDSVRTEYTLDPTRRLLILQIGEGVALGGIVEIFESSKQAGDIQRPVITLRATNATTYVEIPRDGEYDLHYSSTSPDDCLVVDAQIGPVDVIQGKAATVNIETGGLCRNEFRLSAEYVTAIALAQTQWVLEVEPHRTQQSAACFIPAQSPRLVVLSKGAERLRLSLPDDINSTYVALRDCSSGMCDFLTASADVKWVEPVNILSVVQCQRLGDVVPVSVTALSDMHVADIPPRLSALGSLEHVQSIHVCQEDHLWTVLTSELTQKGEHIFTAALNDSPKARARLMLSRPTYAGEVLLVQSANSGLEERLTASHRDSSGCRTVWLGNGEYRLLLEGACDSICLAQFSIWNTPVTISVNMPSITATDQRIVVENWDSLPVDLRSGIIYSTVARRELADASVELSVDPRDLRLQFYSPALNSNIPVDVVTVMRDVLWIKLRIDDLYWADLSRISLVSEHGEIAALRLRPGVDGRLVTASFGQWQPIRVVSGPQGRGAWLRTGDRVVVIERAGDKFLVRGWVGEGVELNGGGAWTCISLPQGALGGQVLLSASDDGPYVMCLFRGQQVVSLWIPDQVVRVAVKSNSGAIYVAAVHDGRLSVWQRL